MKTPKSSDSFGDVELDDAGNIHVLDMDNYQVRVFDPAGRYVNGFGGPGDGPEEFYEPNGLALLSDGSLVVSDRGNRLKVFAKTESGYRRSRTIQIPLVPTSLCSVEDRIFVAGWKREDDTIVHEIAMTPEGANRDIGRGYDAGSSLVRGQLSDGLIACLGYPPRVVFAFSLFPVARAYRADRPELLWTTRVQDYAQTKITERRYSAERSAVAFSHEGVMENLILTHSVSPKHVLLQTGRGERAGPDEASRDPSIRTYLVDAATGRGALVSDSLPLIMAADSNRHVAVWLTPFPRLEVRTAAGSP